MSLQSLADSFHADGFVIIRQMFSPSQVAEIEQNLARFMREAVATMDDGDKYFEETPARPIKSLFRLEFYWPFFKTLMDNQPLLKVMDALWPEGRNTCEGVMFFGKPAGDGSDTPAHQDNAFQCWDPPHALTATIAIDESTPENGPLICQRGSHRIGLLSHRPSGVLGFSQRLVEPLDATRYPEVALQMKPGDVALHHVNTVHRSGPNRTSQSRRQLGLACRNSLARINEQAKAAYRQQLNALLQAHGKAK